MFDCWAGWKDELLGVMSRRLLCAIELHSIKDKSFTPFHHSCLLHFLVPTGKPAFLFNWLLMDGMEEVKELKDWGKRRLIGVDWALPAITIHPVIWRVKLFNEGSSPQFHSIFISSIKRKENISFWFRQFDFMKLNWWSQKDIITVQGYKSWGE